LRDILEAIERIERYVAPVDQADFADELVLVWFVHHLQIIGEAARAMPDSVRELDSEIPWRSIVGMRHILVHEYFGVDVEAVLRVVKSDLPTLKARVLLLLQKIQG